VDARDGGASEEASASPTKSWRPTCVRSVSIDARDRAQQRGQPQQRARRRAQRSRRVPWPAA